MGSSSSKSYIIKTEITTYNIHENIEVFYEADKGELKRIWNNYISMTQILDQDFIW